MAHVVRATGTGLAPDAVAPAALASRLETLEDIVRVGFLQRPAWELLDVIVQDEFTQDVIVRSAAAVFLVFDTT